MKSITTHNDTIFYVPNKLSPVQTMPKVLQCYQCHQRDRRRSGTCLNPITVAQCYQTPPHILLFLIWLENRRKMSSIRNLTVYQQFFRKNSNFFTFSIRPLHKNIFDKIKKYFLLVYFIAKSISLSLLYQINILYHSASRIKY